MPSKAIPRVVALWSRKVGKTYWLQEKKKGSWLRKKLEVRVMKWLQSKREVSKTITMSGILSLFKFDSSPVTWILCKNTKNASADTIENNSVMHYSSNNSNKTNNSSNDARPSFTLAKSLLLFLSLLLVQLFNFPLPVPWEAVPIKSHFVHNKQVWRIKCRCQQRGACWLALNMHIQPSLANSLPAHW